MKNSSRISSLHGFTLVETVIAMGIITIMITGFLAAFGPAVNGIKKSISSQEANRLAGALENELNILSEDELDTVADNGDDKYVTAFEKAFEWIKASNAGTQGSHPDMLLLYQYRGDPTSVNPDGTLAPYTGGSGIPGEDYVLQSVVRRFSETSVESELKPQIVEGHVFCAKLTQLVYNASGELVVSTRLNEIIEPHGTAATTSTNFPEAVLLFRAEFYLLKSNLYAAAENLDPTKLGKPVFTRNMAVRR